MTVSAQHIEYKANIDRWKYVNACVKGPDAIKAGKQDFLIKPHSYSNDEYKDYLERAIYVNITGRTCSSLTGAVMRKEPVIELPSQIEYMKDDTDGGGLSLSQLAKIQTRNILKVARAGLLVDYPPSVESATVEQSAGVNARISEYTAQNIYNWEVEKRGGECILTLVVLRESINAKINQFESKEEAQYRVLYLKDGVYYQDIYDDSEDFVETLQPRKSDGSAWNVIPFVFIGSEENNPDVDMSPLYDLSVVNVGHYRNSADYEEGVFVNGQGTLFLTSEMSTEAFNEANPSGIKMGAKRGHFLGATGTASLLQMRENTAAREAMQDKEKQMVSIGARLITDSSGNETAEAARIKAGSEISVLTTIAGNVSEGITQALKYVCEFMGANPDEVEFAMNTEFFDSKLDPQMIMALIQLADRGDIAKTDIRHDLRKANFFKDGRTDEEIDGEAEVSMLRM